MTEDDISDLFRPFAPVVLKKMFGGTSVYVEGRIVAIEVDGALYMKADAGTQDAFRAAGSQPFTYEAKGKSVRMNYWLLPEAAYDDPDAFEPWFRLSVAASRRSKPAKAKAVRSTVTGPGQGL